MKNQIICPAIMTQTGIVFKGHRHSDCIRTARSIKSLTDFEITHRTEGFITSENVFVNRREAMKIAIEAGQVSKDHKGVDLYSEDLY